MASTTESDAITVTKKYVLRYYEKSGVTTNLLIFGDDGNVIDLDANLGGDSTKVALDVTNIEIKSDLELEIGETLDIAQSITNISDIEPFTIEVKSGNIEKEDNTKITGIEEGTVIITIIGTQSEKTKDITVKVTQPKVLKIGDYVQYNITYTDMYIFGNSSGDDVQAETFSTTNGWRVLDPGTKENGKYTGVKLISTGIPALLHYENTGVKNFEKDGTLGKWTGDSDDRKNYISLFYASNSNGIGVDDNNIYASAGLYYNFGKILFDYGSEASSNRGCFKSINGTTPECINGQNFIIDGVAKSVHNLTLSELNEARNLSSGSSQTANVSGSDAGTTALFKLSELSSEIKNVDFGNNYSPYYWVADPSPGKTTSMCVVAPNGAIDAYWTSFSIGVRPVVLLEDGISLKQGDDGVWR